ncbi:MAG: PH domain-containing protein [Candidatus Hadarchaeales archaeon]
MPEETVSPPFSLLPDEKLLKTLKPERLAFLAYFILAGIFFVSGIAVSTFFPPVGAFLILLAVVLIVALIFYSRAFTYFLTNKRIVIYKRFITISSRQIQYDDLSDVVVDQGIIGRLFGFGNVIPITKSGLGLGMRGWQTGVGGSMRSGPIIVGGPVGGTTVPVATPSTCIYGVKEPFAIKDLVFKYQEEYAEAPYLKRITKAVEGGGKKLSGAKYCPFCGSEIGVSGAEFCPFCGKKLSK